MNANELADELENKPLAYGNDIQEWLGEAATMLRQQQARIDELEASEKLDFEFISSQGDDMVDWYFDFLDAKGARPE